MSSEGLKDYLDDYSWGKPNLTASQCYDLDLCSLHNGARVCQRWHLIARDFSLQKKITIRKTLNENQLKSLVHNHFSKTLEEFYLLKPSSSSPLLAVKRDTLWKLSIQSNRMKKLVLMSCSLSSVSLKDLPPSLLHLSVRESEIYPDLFFGSKPHLSVPHLTCLDIGGVSNFLTSQDLHVFSTLRSLRALYLEGCFRINNGGIESIVDILPQLEILDVEGTDISNDGVRTILQFCSSAKELYIGHTSIDDGAFSAVGENEMPKLSFFCIRNTNISSSGIHTFLMHHLHNQKLVVKADFDCSSNCFNLKDNYMVPGTDGTLPYVADIKCHHYLSHKC
ncbi:uncharacterized protein LOC129224857 [Uloborus diversus]|uniref:uncharacterized protein LOC129224857 n=1 Tax=Uloborus diversus TaxID=327109 RepID=UPI002409EE8C|nr:uncharacterized protein LOC129224857 [Uloborus diversus]